MQVEHLESYLVFDQRVIEQMLNPVIIQSDEFPTSLGLLCPIPPIPTPTEPASASLIFGLLTKLLTCFQHFACSFPNAGSFSPWSFFFLLFWKNVWTKNCKQRKGKHQLSVDCQINFHYGTWMGKQEPKIVLSYSKWCSRTSVLYQKYGS